MLTVAGLEVGYGGPPVLVGVDLEVADGQVVALLGPRGSGKTTLARALVSRPKLLVVDELSAGVSPALAVQLFDVLRGLSLAGVSMLVIDQFVNLANGVADWAIVVENSRVCVCSAPARLALADVSWQSTHPGGGDSANRSKGAPQ